MTDSGKLRCGIIMPISAIDDCSADHWSDVRGILTDAIDEAGFAPSLVSEGDGVTVIHKRIVQNLYDCPMVVCDVSGKNPNVMFELGLRLAFDKPTIIIKDSATSYSFDTSPIEHLEYPRDLRFSKIVEFKEKLSSSISSTYKRAASEDGFSTFLRHFGEFTVPKVEEREVQGFEYIMEELRSLRMTIETSSFRPGNREIKRASAVQRPGFLNLCMRAATEAQIDEAVKIAKGFTGVVGVRKVEQSPDHIHIIVTSSPEIDLDPLRDKIYSNFRRNKLS